MTKLDDRPIAAHLQDLALFGGTPVLPSGPRLLPPFGDDLLPQIADLLTNRPLSSLFGSDDVAEFEAAVASRIGVGGAVAVNSGTSALHLSLLALGVGPGDEVAVTCFSFVATASVIRQVGATPVWIDIDASTLGMDPRDLVLKLTPRTKAVIAAHLFGIPCAIDAIARICRKHGLALVEDACQALGATLNGQAIGSFGTAGCFSFNVNKVVQTGEGGMLVSNDPQLLDAARQMRVNGLSPFGVERLGFNYTLTNLQARLGCAQMAGLDRILERRSRFAAMFAAAIAPYASCLTEGRAGVRRCAYAVPIHLPGLGRPGRDLLVAALGREGVPVSGVYEILYRHEPVFGRPVIWPACPTAEQVIPALLSINPSHRFDDHSAEQICHGLARVLSQLFAINQQAERDEAAIGGFEP